MGPRILFLDAYDSFSNNVAALVESTLDADVTIIKIDDSRFVSSPTAFSNLLRTFDGVIAGPGPGDPRNASDLGLIDQLWKLSPEDVLPVFGVCLGFQSLVLAFGGRVDRLKQPRHGFVTEIIHSGESLFRGLDLVKATQYHSLHAIPSSDTQQRPNVMWMANGDDSSLPLEPLAWDLSDEENGPILMAVRHTDLPFSGVQYHPESICTNESGRGVIENWWSEASAWLQQSARCNTHKDLRPGDLAMSDIDSPLTNSFTSTPNRLSTPASSPPTLDEDTLESTPTATKIPAVQWRSIDASGTDVDIAHLFELLQVSNDNCMLLESGTKNGLPVRAETGRYSIIGCCETKSTRLRYWTNDNVLEIHQDDQVESFSAIMDDVWTHLDDFVEQHRRIDGPSEIPFWGGMVGYINYEAGLETVQIEPPAREDDVADVCFTLVERSLVLDHVEKKVFAQTIKQDDSVWLIAIEAVIQEMLRGEGSLGSKRTGGRPFRAMQTTKEGVTLNEPAKEAYCSKVDVCQSHICAGSSYELCLTDETKMTFPFRYDASKAWSLYLRLRSSNPAPFAAYLHLNPSSDDEHFILSSSPERFLSWTRTGECQFRPIKGTVKKDGATTREMALAVLTSRKEQAENLMIVDLIRHDLHGVVGAGGATVRKLMSVEEYETVYQLVSVIEGRVSEGSGKRCIDVLAASLPPGSMTGAPKRRSCELLKEIEGGRRGVYAGVLGYLDVGGGGDFSVVIRTATVHRSIVSVGAGGAVTALSDSVSEYEEMLTKRESVLGAILT